MMPVKIYACCPEDDYESIELLDPYVDGLWLDSGDDMRFVKRIQHMYENTDEEWFLTGADDISFKNGWLSGVLKLMEKYSVISFDDQCNPNLPGTNFLIRRDYIEKYSGVMDAPNTVFHQGYFHNFCDNELVAVASKRGKFVKSELIISHNHPTIGKSKWDKVYEMAQQRFESDAAIFHSREILWS
jgi:hypothetical protein